MTDTPQNPEQVDLETVRLLIRRYATMIQMILASDPNDADDKTGEFIHSMREVYATIPMQIAEYLWPVDTVLVIWNAMYGIDIVGELEKQDAEEPEEEEVAE